MRTKLEFKAKDVDEAITKACAKMHAAREELNIEIISTGSSGIFGLCKKKACILVTKKNTHVEPDTTHPPSEPVVDEADESPSETVEPEVTEKQQPEAKPEPTAPTEQSETPEPVVKQSPKVKEEKPEKTTKDKKPQQKTQQKREQQRRNQEPPAPLTPEIAEQIETNLGKLLTLMDFPSEITIEEGENNKSLVNISGDFVDDITASDGQVIDSLQYLMRKIIGKKFPEKIIFSIDAGGFRARRKKELQELALKLAQEVKDTEKTRTIAPLNPAERRIVHLELQDDKTIRSRSVGEGLFKKIIIYLPGKGRSRRRGPRKKKNKRRT